MGTGEARAGAAKAAIQEMNRTFMEAFARHDAPAIASLYGAGAQLMPPGSDFVTGTDAIRDFWQGVMKMGISQAKLETIELEHAGDTALEVGRYTLSLEDGRVADRGKYLVVWKQEGPQWRLYRDVWNTSQPPK
jgi:uncharacterized protein (TIGR02246 family)